MHADVIGDSIVTASIHRDGRFLLFEGPDSADPAVYTLPSSDEGAPLILHGPLVQILGAGLMMLSGSSSTVPAAYLSLRILSLIAGMLIILLSYRIASRLLEPEAGLIVAAWCAASYVLIDYAGNGAIYTFQSALYLLWLLIALSPSSQYRAPLLGLVAGLNYLVNFQSVILIPAAFILFIVQERTWAKRAGYCAIFIAVMTFVAAPWLVRNALLFGDPFYSHAYNMGYAYMKAGIDVPLEAITDVSFSNTLVVAITAIQSWIPNNLYYAARKLFVIAPLAFILFSYGLIDITFSRERFRRSLPLLTLLLLQMLLYAGWPVWKFRFFVPLLPFVFLLAVEELWHLPITRMVKRTSAGVILLAFMAIGVLTYRATPVHTTYYDGAITQDPFHGSEEVTFLRNFHVLPADNAP